MFECDGEGGLLLVAANEGYRALFGDAAPSPGDRVTNILPGADPQTRRIVEGVLEGGSFSAEAWAVTAPAGTYATGVAYCDWTLRTVESFARPGLVLHVTDVTRRTEREQELAEEVLRLRDLLAVGTDRPRSD